MFFQHQLLELVVRVSQGDHEEPKERVVQCLGFCPHPPHQHPEPHAAHGLLVHAHEGILASKDEDEEAPLCKLWHLHNAQHLVQKGNGDYERHRVRLRVVHSLRGDAVLDHERVEPDQADGCPAQTEPGQRDAVAGHATPHHPDDLGLQPREQQARRHKFQALHGTDALELGVKAPHHVRNCAPLVTLAAAARLARMVDGLHHQDSEDEELVDGNDTVFVQRLLRHEDGQDPVGNQVLAVLVRRLEKSMLHQIHDVWDHQVVDVDHKE
mmetsp:Transcript_58084/g.149538  ORF Transcript_58084/g.149538 Transcript_58084/m.149538 type:complete len:268 (-) Transcript_58084:278-1081(-)